MVHSLESETVKFFRRYLADEAGNGGEATELVGGPYGDRRFRVPPGINFDGRIAIPANRDETLFALYAVNGEGSVGLFVGLHEKEALPFLAGSRVRIAGGSGGPV